MSEWRLRGLRPRSTSQSVCVSEKLIEPSSRWATTGRLSLLTARGEKAPPTADTVTHIIKVRVHDVDAAFERACGAGARVISAPTTFEYGERSCELADPAGHRWELTETVRDVQPEEWGGLTISTW